MDATICDRCQTIMVKGVDPTYRIQKNDFSALGTLKDHYGIDLCETCNEKFNRFMNEIDDEEAQ